MLMHSTVRLRKQKDAHQEAERAILGSRRWYLRSKPRPQSPQDMKGQDSHIPLQTWFTALQALYLVGQFDPSTTKSVLWQ
jgi:hypothetical protein